MVDRKSYVSLKNVWATVCRSPPVLRHLNRIGHPLFTDTHLHDRRLDLRPATYIIVLGIALTRGPRMVRDYSVATTVAVGTSYVYPYAQVIYLRWSPGYAAWLEAGLALVALAACLSLVSLGRDCLHSGGRRSQART